MLSELSLQVSHTVDKKPAGRKGSITEPRSILGKACSEQRWEEKEQAFLRSWEVFRNSLRG